MSFNIIMHIKHQFINDFQGKCVPDCDEDQCAYGNPCQANSQVNDCSKII